MKGREVRGTVNWVRGVGATERKLIIDLNEPVDMRRFLLDVTIYLTHAPKTIPPWLEGLTGHMAALNDLAFEAEGDVLRIVLKNGDVLPEKFFTIMDAIGAHVTAPTENEAKMNFRAYTIRWYD